MQPNFCIGAPMKFIAIKSARNFLVFILGSLLSFTTLADFEKGIEANRSGDRETAFINFHAASLAQDKRAYGKLGSMYLYGLGTEKNYQQAYVWFHMAYLIGEKEGLRFRDAASSMLSSEQQSKAVDAAESQRIKLDIDKIPKP